MSDTFNQLPDTTVDQIMLANARWSDFHRLHPDAVNTTIGILIDPETTMPWQPKTVTEARENALRKININHTYGYQTQVGNSAFLEEAGRMVLGAKLYKQNASELLAYQTLGGTGALSLTKDTLLAFKTEDSKAGIPLILDPGWPNHPAIFSSPFTLTTYTHVDPRNGLYNHQAALNVIKSAPENPILLLQTCGYNDDGVDRTKQQWDEICAAALQKNAVIILDSAYLGLAEGLSLDRYPIELFMQKGLLTFVCVSFSKNMGFYNERLGALFIANAKAHIGTQQSDNLHQLIMRIIRRTISSPPLLAAQAAAISLGKPSYYEELEKARLSIVANRQAFARYLKGQLPQVVGGNGLFTKLLVDGFTPRQINLLENDGILALSNSRLNLGSMRLDQVKRVGITISRVLEA